MSSKKFSMFKLSFNKGYSVAYVYVTINYAVSFSKCRVIFRAL